MLSITPLPPQPAPPRRRLDPAGDSSRRGLVGGDDHAAHADGTAADDSAAATDGTPDLKILSGREMRAPTTYASTTRRSSRSADGHRVLARRSRPNPRADVEAKRPARRPSLTPRPAGRRDGGSLW